MPAPTLVVVGGPPGSGKTTLAHALAAAIGCPAVCRDEIKEGMVHADGGDIRAEPGDPLTVRTLPVFFEVLRVLAAAGVTVVAEAAFQDRLWRSGLEPLSGLSELRVVHCTTAAAVARDRAVRRLAGSQSTRKAHEAQLPDPAEWERMFGSFDRVSVPAPSIVVDTTDGYVPALDEIVEFVGRG